jgi:ABC-type multidrug transport system fused ATPase/permease subunit
MYEIHNTKNHYPLIFAPLYFRNIVEELPPISIKVPEKPYPPGKPRDNSHIFRSLLVVLPSVSLSFFIDITFGFIVIFGVLLFFIIAYFSSNSKDKQKYEKDLQDYNKRMIEYRIKYNEFEQIKRAEHNEENISNYRKNRIKENLNLSTKPNIHVQN